MSPPSFDQLVWADHLLLVWLGGAVALAGLAAYGALTRRPQVLARAMAWGRVTWCAGPVGFVLGMVWHFSPGSVVLIGVLATVLGVAVVLARRQGRARRLTEWPRWTRRTVVAGGVMAGLLAVAMVIAYMWEPPEERGFESQYRADIGATHVETPIARFHYVKEGAGPPVVLVPGGTLWLYSYRDLIAELSSDFTVYVVDMPGQGYTDEVADDFDYDLEAMSDALGTFMSAMDVERASVVGHSWGGAIALAFAERHPERVTKLGLIASPGLDDPSTALFEAQELPVVGELIGKLLSRSSFSDGLRNNFVHEERLTELDIAEYWAPMSRRDNRTAMWRQQRSFDYSLTDRGLGDVDAPTLVLWGDQDRTVEPWQAPALGRRINDATVEVLPGCGHMLHEDCPTAAIQALQRFLSDDSSTRSPLNRSRARHLAGAHRRSGTNQ